MSDPLLSVSDDLTLHETGFLSCVDHACLIQSQIDRLFAKIGHLKAARKEALISGEGFVTQVAPTVLVEGAQRLSDADVSGRLRITKAAHKVMRDVVTKRGRDGNAIRWPQLGRWYVYLLTDDEDSVLYIGMTSNPAARMSKHRSRCQDWTQVEFIAVADKDAASRLEGDLIFHHQPRDNRADTKARRFVS